MADDRSELLRSLTIERETPRGGAGAWPFVALLAILIAAGAVGWALFLRPAATPPPAPTTVATPSPNPAPSAGDAAAPPVAAPAPRERGGLVASGYVVARRSATVSADVQGRLVEILFEEGAAVEEGQLLARLDVELPEIDLALARARADSSRAAVDAITADLAEARASLERTQRLSTTSFASQAELDIAEARVASLAARLDGARADARVAALSADRSAEILDRYLVRAPFAGIVIAKNAQPGEILSPGSAGGGFTRTGVATLVDMNSLEIEVDVNESQIESIKPEQRVEITLDAYPNERLPGRVIAIIPTANRDRATIVVRVGFDRRDPRILPEMAAKVTFDRSGDRSGR